MTTRAGLTAVALCAAALACDRGEPPARSDAGAAARPGARAPAGPAQAPPPARPPDRGDRHARGAAGRARAVHEVLGTVVRAQPGQVAIRPRDGREITLRIGPGTTVRAPAGERAALAPGDEVRASWRGGEGDPPTALSVEIRQRDPATDRG